MTDYIPHHEPFQYYPQTANPKHTPPASLDEIGHDGPANHQYDLVDFWTAVDAGKLPAVSYLKAAGYQDGHAGSKTTGVLAGLGTNHSTHVTRRSRTCSISTRRTAMATPSGTAIEVRRRAGDATQNHSGLVPVTHNRSNAN